MNAQRRMTVRRLCRAPALAVPTASAAGHRGKSRIYPDEGVFMSLGWLTFVE
jgi:hypothetical protein